MKFIFNQDCKNSLIYSSRSDYPELLFYPLSDQVTSSLSALKAVMISMLAYDHKHLSLDNRNKYAYGNIC